MVIFKYIWLLSEENEEDIQFDLTYTKEFIRSSKKLDYSQILEGTRHTLFGGKTY